MHAQVYGIYGGERPVAAAKEALPDLRGFDKATVRKCILRYGLWGWSSYVPSACRNTSLIIPQNIAPWLWGWPHRFTKRMRATGTDIILAGKYDRSNFASGIDSIAALNKVPADFDGYIWTNRIALIGPHVAQTTN